MPDSHHHTNTRAAKAMLAEYRDTRATIFGVRLWFKGPHRFDQYANFRHCCSGELEGQRVFCDSVNVFAEEEDDCCGLTQYFALQQEEEKRLKEEGEHLNDIATPTAAVPAVHN